MTTKFIFAPLEQFQILSLTNIFGLKYIITNFVLINALSLLLFVGLICLNSPKIKNLFNNSLFYFLPNVWQKSIEFFSEIVTNIISNFISNSSEKYFPVIATLFNFILFSNLVGLLPYSFTTTSHLIITFTLSFAIFIGISIITFKKYSLESFSLFLPANTSFFLALLLVPIEFVSYLAKPISLGARLFINLMAGHSTLKIVIGFAWSMLLLENFLSFGFFIPMIVLVVLFGLELGIALIQTYVFIVLTCIYIQEGS